MGGCVLPPGAGAQILIRDLLFPESPAGLPSLDISKRLDDVRSSVLTQVKSFLY